MRYHPNDALDSAYKCVRAAEQARDALIQELYPVGDVVFYSHGDHAIEVEVVDHERHRIKVRSTSSGRSYWIDASRLCA